jgi:hypothetical protein
MGTNRRVDRRFAVGLAVHAPVARSPVVAFHDRWGEVEQQFDMTASGLPAPLIGLFADAFRGHYASAAAATRTKCWKAQKIFARYLASLETPLTPGDLGGHLVGGYIAWLDVQRRTDNEPWSLDTRNSLYTAIKLLLTWLVATERIPPIDFPDNPFPGRHASRSQIRLAEAQLKDILTACYREIDAAWSRFEEGQRLLAQRDRASDPAALLHELHRLGDGIMPRTDRTAALTNRIQSLGGTLQVAQYLHLTSSTLAPFFVAIAIQTAANPDALRHIVRDCLVPHPLDPNRVMIEWAKPRAGGAMRRAQRRSFDRRRPNAAPNLIEKLLMMTAPLAAHAGPGNRNYLFVVRGNGRRGIAPIAPQTLTNSIRAFIDRANAHIAASKGTSSQTLLPDFTAKQFRGSVATRHYVASGGDVRVAQTILNHARSDTTDLYVRGPEARRIQDETIARLQAMMVQWIAGNRNGDPVRPSADAVSSRPAHATGHICANPLAGIAPGASPGHLCPAFLGCLACPGLVIPIDAEHLARVLQLKSALEAARDRIDAHRWKLLYGPSYRIIIDDILPDFPEGLNDPAYRLMVFLPPLGELE